jgi:hypothetical protein
MKYAEKKIEIYNIEQLHENQKIINNQLGIEDTQRMINKKSKKPKRNHQTGKAYYLKDDASLFNIVHRIKIEEVKNMKLNKNEKLVYYVLRDFINHPSNCVMINDSIPSFKELEPIVSLTERTIRDCLKTLQDKNLLKLVQSGHKKAIYINPEYYATGKELNIETLQLFGLLDIDDAKINSYLSK